MGDIFRRHPEYFIPDQETGFRKVASGCCAYNDVRNMLKSYFWLKKRKNSNFPLNCIITVGEFFKVPRPQGFSGNWKVSSSHRKANKRLWIHWSPS